MNGKFPYTSDQEALKMPQKDQSKLMGKSPSPVVDRVLQNNKNVQQPVNPQTVTKTGQSNKQPVSLKSGKK